MEHYPEFEYGDAVVVYGRVERPENFEADMDEPGRPFDYVSYLAKDDIFYQMFYPKIKLVSKEGAVILDPFLGSGTTARAAKDLGRKCIGIEISKEYCDIAVDRLRQGVLAL